MSRSLAAAAAWAEEDEADGAGTAAEVTEEREAGRDDAAVGTVADRGGADEGDDLPWRYREIEAVEDDAAVGDESDVFSVEHGRRRRLYNFEIEIDDRGSGGHHAEESARIGCAMDAHRNVAGTDGREDDAAARGRCRLADD